MYVYGVAPVCAFWAPVPLLRSLRDPLWVPLPCCVRLCPPEG